jgi:hypothetical protein
MIAGGVLGLILAHTRLGFPFRVAVVAQLAGEPKAGVIAPYRASAISGLA